MHKVGILGGSIALVLIIVLIAVMALRALRDPYGGEIRFTDPDKMPIRCRENYSGAWENYSGAWENYSGAWHCEYTELGITCTCAGASAEYRRGGW